MHKRLLDLLWLSHRLLIVGWAHLLHVSSLLGLLKAEPGIQILEVEDLVVFEMGYVLVDVQLVLFLHLTSAVVTKHNIEQRNDEHCWEHGFLCITLQYPVPANHKEWLNDSVEQGHEVK